MMCRNAFCCMFLIFLSLCLLFVGYATAEEAKGKEVEKQPGGYRLGKEITLLSAAEAKKISATATSEPGGLLRLDGKLYLGPSDEPIKPIPISGTSDMYGIPDVLPDEIIQYIPPEIYKTLKAVKSVSAEDISFKVLKSEDPKWNKKMSYFITKDKSTMVTLDGPATLIVVSLLDIPSDVSGLKRYTVAMLEGDEEISDITFNTPRMEKVVSSKPPDFQCGIPGIFTFSVPKGEHSYKFDLVSSEAGDVGLRFFMPAE